MHLSVPYGIMNVNQETNEIFIILLTPLLIRWICVAQKPRMSHICLHIATVWSMLIFEAYKASRGLD